jgi:hypothetical protein
MKVPTFLTTMPNLERQIYNYYKIFLTFLNEWLMPTLIFSIKSSNYFDLTGEV